MAKKSNNKKSSVKKKKVPAKVTSNKQKKTVNNKSTKAVSKPQKKSSAGKKKTATAPKKKNIKTAAKNAPKKTKAKPTPAVKQKVAKKETKPKKSDIIVVVEKAVKEAAPIVAKKTAKTKEAKPPKIKEKKIIKAPLIIPNQKIGERALAPTSKKAEPKGKFELEFVVRSSPAVLFELLSTPSGLSEWFADDVNIRDDVFTFFWDGTPQSARVLGLKDQEYIRFQWLEKKDGSYFEFRLQIDELTNDVSLIIIDFAENDSEKASTSLLWESQVNKMLHVLGSYF